MPVKSSIPTLPVPCGASNISPSPPPVEIVRSPIVLEIVEEEPSTSSLAVGLLTPIPTLPLLKIVNSLDELSALSTLKYLPLAPVTSKTNVASFTVLPPSTRVSVVDVK